MQFLGNVSSCEQKIIVRDFECLIVVFCLILSTIVIHFYVLDFRKSSFVNQINENMRLFIVTLSQFNKMNILKAS